LVLSADLKSILLNEGIVHEELKPSEVPERIKEEKARIKPGKIKPQTNLGIRLGMSLKEVQRKLGKPTKSMWSKRFNAQELIYRKATPKDKEGMGVAYSNYYLFKGGKLFYIELAQDSMGGG
jgi:hypothetical protein